MITNDQSSSHEPLRFDLEVAAGGKVEFQLPLPTGTPVTVYVVEQPADEFGDLLAAATSSLGFWDNPEDDEDWNNA